MSCASDGPKSKTPVSCSIDRGGKIRGSLYKGNEVDSQFGWGAGSTITGILDFDLSEYDPRTCLSPHRPQAIPSRRTLSASTDQLCWWAMPLTHRSDPRKPQLVDGGTQTAPDERTRMSEYQSLVQITLPDGPLQEERDVTLRLTLDQAFLDFDNCKSLEPVWEQYLVLFNHDAGEVARDWWSKSANNYHVQLFTH
ncbi:hypothetical protein B0H14DRAFT_2564355 [Mycena olivaceomarginata]|nr:hypothetical protein B0H14DRAFT_2564355 [Mycena olivaceomarginata]